MVHHKYSRADLKQTLAATNTELRPGAVQLLTWLHARGVRTTIVSAGLTDIICSFLQLHGLRFDSLEIIANRCVWSGDSDAAVLTGFKGPLIHSANKDDVVGASLAPWQPAAVGGRGGDSGVVRGGEQALGPNVLVGGNSIGDVAVLAGMRHQTALSYGYLATGVASVPYRTNEPSCPAESSLDALQLPTVVIPHATDSNGDIDVALCDSFDDESESASRLASYLKAYDVVICGLKTDMVPMLSLLEEIAGSGDPSRNAEKL